MHPQLLVENNPYCAELILAFQKCHEDGGYWGRMTGACNDEKQVMIDCFKAQKKVVRKGLLDKARAERARWKQKCEELGD